MAEDKPTKTSTAKPATDIDDEPIVSSDADKSTYKTNPDPNPEGVTPEPGPSTIQEPGKP